ncbi:MAG: penicillin-binding protein activator [Desulfobacterales bacterium]|nr:penicillin-binding protein activator [Desulfobacterales bacterium]
MKTNNYIAALILFFLVFSCTPKQPPNFFLKTEGVSDNLFASAEKAFDKSDYPKAIELYNEYLAKYPNGQMASSCLFKLGVVHLYVEDYDKALTYFSSLVEKYPNDSLANDANIEVLTVFFNQRQYNEVIQKAEKLIDSELSQLNLVRKYHIMGDSYLALGSPADAFYSYVFIFDQPVSFNDAVLHKIKDTASMISYEDISHILKEMSTVKKKGNLIYQIGVNEFGKNNDKSFKILSEFINDYPDDENFENAKLLIEDLRKSLEYNRYTVGCLLPLSGPYQYFGNKLLKGIEFAIQKFYLDNPNSRITITIKDSGSDAKKAEAAVDELNQEKVAAIIGPLIFAENAIAKAQEYKIPIITLSQKDDIPKIGDYVFRNFITSKMQVNTLVSYAVENLGLKNFAILYPKESYGKIFMNLFWDEVTLKGGQIVGAEHYLSDQTDFAETIKKIVGTYYAYPEDIKQKILSSSKLSLNANDIKETEIIDEDGHETNIHDDIDDEISQNYSNNNEIKAIVDFEAIFIPDTPKTSGLLIPQLPFYDIENIVLLGTNLWHSEKLIEIARQEAQGSILVDGFFSDSLKPSVVDFVSKFRDIYGENPEFMEAIGFDTAKIIFTILNKPDVNSRSAIKDQLLKIKDFDGVTGSTCFNNTGDVEKKMYVLQVRGSGFTELQAP